MGKKVRSARGVEVDFDLLRIKQQIADSPAVDVANREAFVEKRLRRRTKRTVISAKVTEKVEPEVSPVTEDQPVDDTIRPTRKRTNG